jgi:serine protease DegQ
VVAVGGAPVANATQLRNAVAAMKPKTVAAIGVQRGEKALDVNITIGVRPKAPAQSQREP